MDIPPSTKTAAATKTKPISLNSYLSSSSKLQTPKKYDTSKFSVTTKIYPQNFTGNIWNSTNVLYVCKGSSIYFIDFSEKVTFLFPDTYVYVSTAIKC